MGVAWQDPQLISNRVLQPLLRELQIHPSHSQYNNGLPGSESTSAFFFIAFILHAYLTIPWALSDAHVASLDSSSENAAELVFPQIQNADVTAALNSAGNAGLHLQADSRSTGK
jgi:hypothetical protein